MEVPDYVISYAQEHCHEPPGMEKLRQFNEMRQDGYFQTIKHQAAFLAFMVDLIDAERIVEYGTYTGYSAAMMASRLPAGGKLYAVDMNKEYLNLATEAWAEIGVGDKCVPVHADALTTMAFESNGTFDMIYVDVDRMAILPHLYEKCLRLLRTGGVLAIDNVFWAGEVANRSINEYVVGIQEFNDYVFEDNRVRSVMLPGLGDGLTLVMKQ